MMKGIVDGSGVYFSENEEDVEKNTLVGRRSRETTVQNH
jgi:hypothetical protein